DEPGKGAEKNQQDRGRHSNLPFDRTDARTGRTGSRAPGIRRRVLLAGPVREDVVRQVSWLPDRPPSGSFPHARPVSRSLASRGLPPEASPVTVAGGARGFFPPPPSPPSEKAVVRRTRALACLLFFPHELA